MTWHPLTLAVWLLDGLALAVYAAAGWRIVHALSGWQPLSADRFQLQREADLELAVHQGRWILALQVVGLVLLLIGISNIWPAFVPGAMCGQGVMQSLGAAGWQTLAVRLAVLALLHTWAVLQGIENAHPGHQLGETCARLLLSSGPLIAAGSLTLANALDAVAPDQAVSCCAALYARAGSWGLPSLGDALDGWQWVMVNAGGSAVVLMHGWSQWRSPAPRYVKTRTLTALLTFAWVASAVMMLRYAVAPYVLEVLRHPCPWCLMLGDHHALGFLYFGLPAAVAAETLAAMAAGAAARRCPRLAPAAHVRIQSAGRRILAAVLGFHLLAALPAVIWRVRFGGWMT